MFKKNISVSQKRQASGKDLKQLKRDIQKFFRSLSEEDLGELLPQKCRMDILKLSNKAVAYSIDNQILFFDPNGKADLLIPAMQTLWKHPSLLPSLQTWSEVSTKILGGADMFLQGLVLEDGTLPAFGEGDTMALRVDSNPLPFAVGQMEVSSQSIARNGLKGKGIRILHSFGDQLWALGNRAVPDTSFTQTRIFAKDSPAEPDENGARTMQDSTAQLNSLSLDESLSPPSQSQPIDSDSTPAGVDPVNPSSRPQQGEPEAEQADASASTQQESGRGEESPAGQGMSQDELAAFCLLAGLVLLKDKDLPIITSDFYSKFMVPSRPPGMAIDLKKSSYKKLSKLLASFEKQGVLKQKVTHGKEYITTVVRDHELYRSAKKTSSAKKDTQVVGSTETVATEKATSSKISITACYRVPSSLKPFFVGVCSQGSQSELFTGPQVAEALREYAEYNQLLADSPENLKLDKLMVSTLFNKKDPVIEGNPHPLKDIEQRLFSKLQLFQQTRRLDADGKEKVVITKGNLHAIEVQLEDRSGGRKHISHIRNFEAFTLEADELSTALQRKFQSSASVQNMPGKTDTRKEILLQGDCTKHIAEFLISTYGLASNQIEVQRKGRSGK